MKQTAVEWLVEQLPQRMKNYLNDSIALAKAMEKEQIKDAWINSLTTGDYQSSEQYYTETYEQSKQG